MRIFQMDKTALQRHFNVDLTFGRVNDRARKRNIFKRLVNGVVGTFKLLRTKLTFTCIVSLASFLIAAVFSYLNQSMEMFYLSLVSIPLSLLFPIVESAILYRYKRSYYNRIDSKRRKISVLREGKRRIISSYELQLGDVVYLEAGMVIPADIRIFESDSLYADDKRVFGSTIPSMKTCEPLDDPALTPEFQRNMAWKGSTIDSGNGIGIVSALGEDCYVDKTGGRKERKQHSFFFNMQSNVSRMFAYVYLFFVAIVLLIGVIFGDSKVEAFLIAGVLTSLITINPLSFITEWTYYRTAEKLNTEGALIRNFDAFDGMNREKEVYFDADDLLTNHLIYRETVAFSESEKNNLSYFSLCMGEGYYSDAVAKALEKYDLDFKTLDRKYPVFRRERDHCGNWYGLFSKNGHSIVVATGYWKMILPLLSHTDDSLFTHINALEQQGKYVCLVTSDVMDFIPHRLDVSEFSAGMRLCGMLVFDAELDNQAKTIISRFRKVGVSVNLLSQYSPVFSQRLTELYGMNRSYDSAPDTAGYSNPQHHDEAPAVYESASQSIKEQASLVLADGVKPQNIIYSVKCMFCGLKRSVNFLSIIVLALFIVAAALLLSAAEMNKVAPSLLSVLPAVLLPCNFLMETARNFLQYKRSYILGLLCAFSGVASLFFGLETAFLSLTLSFVALSVYLMISAMPYRKVRIFDIIILVGVLIIAFIPWMGFATNDLLSSLILAVFPAIGGILLDLLY